jgi:AraC family transcriptional regulator, transcriptional activator FtrA
MAHRVVTVVAPGSNPFEFSVSCEVFGIPRPELGVEWYEHKLVAAARPLVTSAGWTIDTPHGLETLAEAQTVVVPACPHNPPQEMVDALRAAYDRGARMVSFCAGAWALAAAGILDGRRATTHWMHARDLGVTYPTIRVDADALYVDEGQVLTSAGTAGGIDLALYIVRLDHGPEVANHVARRMVVAPHRDGGQSQFVTSPVPDAPYEDAITPVMDWMFEHLDEPLSVPQLARLAAMSTRAFTRRFGEVTGTSPVRWLTHQRILRTQDLLQATDLTIDTVAGRVGFGSAANLRKHFRRQVGMTPREYRDHHRRELPEERRA